MRTGTARRIRVVWRHTRLYSGEWFRDAEISLLLADYDARTSSLSLSLFFLFGSLPTSVPRFTPSFEHAAPSLADDDAIYVTGKWRLYQVDDDDDDDDDDDEGDEGDEGNEGDGDDEDDDDDDDDGKDDNNRRRWWE